jgi:hypothetical protein
MTSPTEYAPGLTLQGFNAPLNLKDFKLVAFDMDSTLICIECVDEIADAVGRMAEVAATTEAERSLRARQLTKTDRAGDAIAQWPLPHDQRRRSGSRYRAVAGPSSWRWAGRLIASATTTDS